MSSLLLTSLTVWASRAGSILGFVQNSSRTLVPGARITLTNRATGARLTAASNDGGAFQFPQFPPTGYFAIAEAPGFKKTSIGAILVEVDQITRVNITLEIGSLTEAVEVAAATTARATDSGSSPKYLYD